LSITTPRREPQSKTRCSALFQRSRTTHAHGDTPRCLQVIAWIALNMLATARGSRCRCDPASNEHSGATCA
jgi:hypothetical protein